MRRQKLLNLRTIFSLLLMVIGAHAALAGPAELQPERYGYYNRSGNWVTTRWVCPHGYFIWEKAGLFGNYYTCYRNSSLIDNNQLRQLTSVMNPFVNKEGANEDLSEDEARSSGAMLESATPIKNSPAIYSTSTTTDESNNQLGVRGT